MERGQAELMTQRIPAGGGSGGINLGASLAITAVLTLGLFLIFRSGVLGAPKPPAGGPLPGDELERARNFYEDDLARLGCDTVLSGQTVDQIYSQYLAAFLECARLIYENDLFKKFGYTGSLQGATTDAIYESYLFVLEQFTGG